MRAKRHRAILLASVFVLGAIAVGAGDAHAAIPCSALDQCMQNGVCQIDGTCVGTPKPNGTACDDANDCTNNDKCQAGKCNGVPKTGSCNDLNDCTIDDKCQIDGSCEGTPDVEGNGKACHFVGLCGPGTCVVEVINFPPLPPFSFAICQPDDPENPLGCPIGSDKCSPGFCNPANGECQAFTNTCPGQCGSCDPSTGNCTLNPKPNGASCDDFDECTMNDACVAGECRGSGAGGPTPTFTPPGGVPTATVAASPTRTPTVTTTRTRTSTLTPTATITSTATRTATSTPTSTVAGATPTTTPTKIASGCFGDCNVSGTLTASDIGRINQTILKCGPCAGGAPGGVATGCAALAIGCVAADFNGDGCLKASELGRANQNILKFQPSGCPPATP